MTAYFKYDSTTKVFIPGVIFSDTPVENATTVDPANSNYSGALTFNGTEWVSNETKEAYANRMQKENPEVKDNQQQINSQLMQQIMLLKDQLAKGGTTNA